MQSYGLYIFVSPIHTINEHQRTLLPNIKIFLCFTERYAKRYNFFEQYKNTLNSKVFLVKYYF